MKKTIAIAMSGGVDSSVAAALLKRAGFNVIGVTLSFNLSGSLRKRPICCGTKGIEDAQRVAHKLKIKHYVFRMQDKLEELVIRPFFQEYLKGRTPNPCIRCNQYLKFNLLLKKALSLGAEFLATGHYARVVRIQSRGAKSQRYLLKKARDRKKDQSYFLYSLSQKQLQHILFPLGNYKKSRVRELAREFGLSVADKLESQEICFLPTGDYREFLKERLKTELRPGQIIDKQGNLLGRHKGIAFYTIGQREGLGIAKGYPLYVKKIDYKNNRIVVGKREDAYKKEFLVKKPHFILKPLKKKVVVKTRIRYNHKEAPAEIIPFGNKIRVRFKKPQFAITPGQAAVFYEKDNLLGGGIISDVRNGI